MLPRALLIGASGRLPFNGHMRLHLGDERASADIAARVAAGCPPVEAWAAVRRLHAALQDVPSEGIALELIAAVFRRIDAVSDELGPARGEDLAVLVVASDSGGISWAGRGLSKVWSAEDGRPIEEGDVASGPLFALGAGDPEPRDLSDVEALVG